MNTMVGLPYARISELSSQDALKSKSVVAFAQDTMDENSLLCVMPDGKGGETVVTWDCDDNSVSEDLKMSYGEYLESISSQLLSCKLAYEEELGLCEVVQ
jgi:hypothetical protein